MALSDKDAVRVANQLIAMHAAKRTRLDVIREYLRDDMDWTGGQKNRRRTRFLPPGVPPEVRELLDMARVNMIRFVVRAAVQMMYLNGYRSRQSTENEPAWSALWQPNQMDSRQIGIHRAALCYGESFVTVLPGQGTGSVQLRGVSPRYITAAYGDDDTWPEYAVEKRKTGWRLYDNETVYSLVDSTKDDEQRQKEKYDQPREVWDSTTNALKVASTAPHPAGVTPVVRYRDTDDLDDPVVGIVEPLMKLQDQIDFTTFGLLVAQHFGAFRQRYVLGWLADNEEEKIKVSASRLMMFEDSPEDVKVGEFAQTDLSGYLNSRDASTRHLATVSQTSAYELLGQLVQMSAEALVAAQASSQRAAREYRTVVGEAHEQTLWLGGRLLGQPPKPDAEVRWQDMELTSIAQIADALGKLADQLGIPKRALWERAADALGESQTEVERWSAMVTEGNAVETLLQALERQGRGAGPAAGGSGAGGA